MASVVAQFPGWRPFAPRRLETNVLETGAPRTALPGKGLQGGHSCVIGMATVRQDRYDGDGRDSTASRKHRRDSSVIVAAPQGIDEVVGLPISVDYISSPNNSYVKHLVRLRQSAKTRNRTASILVVGTVPLREICESVEEERRFLLIDVLLIREDAEASECLADLSRRIVRVSSAAMSKLSGLDSPPEAVGVLRFPSTFTCFEGSGDAAMSNCGMQNWCSSPRRILVLDSIQDPGNMGTLLRTAAAFAWDGVFLLHGCCDPFNDKALRAARGASFRMPIATGEWNHVRNFAFANKLKLYSGDPESYAAASHLKFGRPPLGGNMQEPELAVHDGGGLCLVLGNEGQGLSEDVTRDCCSIGIPMPGNFESLNVAVAGGILMFLLR